MKRLLIAVCVLAMALLNAAPADAATKECQATGTMTTAAPLTLTSRTTSFTMSLTALCSSGLQNLTASGSLTGTCTLTTGTGSNFNGSAGAWVKVGPGINVTAGATATATFEATATTGIDCLGVTSWTVVGVIVTI